VIDSVGEHVAVGAVALQINGIAEANVEPPDGASAAHGQRGHRRP
jgi:hypothetical protein